MEITYSSRIRKYFDSPRSLQRAFPNNYKNIEALLHALKKAENAGKILYGKPHPLKGARQGQLAIGVGKSLRMVLEPGADDPQHGSKTPTWRVVRQVKILEITNYH